MHDPGERYLVEAVAGRADDRADLPTPSAPLRPEGLEIRGPVVIEHGREIVIQAIVDVIDPLAGAWSSEWVKANPNAFKGSTLIHHNVGEFGRVRLSIYGAQGSLGQII
jgi:hypothetical protein